MSERQPVKFLEGNTVFLRPFEESDFSFYYKEAFWDEEVRKLTGMKEVYSRTSIENFLKNSAKDDATVNLLICLQKSNEIIGDIALKEIDRSNQNAEIDISIFKRDFRGNGYGSEALELLLNYGFNQVNLHRIGLIVYSYNIYAKRFYEKLGFREEGTIRENFFYNGDYHDSIYMGMLKKEFKKR